MKKANIAIALVLVTLGACGKAYQVHPGAVNTFDSQAYDTLIVAKAAIDQCKTDVSNGTFTGAVLANVETALNGLITAYNVMDSAYQVYHAAAVAGTATPAQQASVTAGATQVTTAMSNLTAAKGGK